MSGQYPHPSAPSSQQHQFSRQHGPPHHLPPAPPGQYCPPQGPSQRMRGPPPQHWVHPTHNTGNIDLILMKACFIALCVCEKFLRLG